MKARATSRHPMTVISTCADLDAELLRLAATSSIYKPAGPSDDNPAEWAALPARTAPHRCGCGARFHVRRHLEAHTCGAGR